MSKLNKIGVKWLNDNYGDLEIFESPEYPNYVFYIKNGKLIFDYNKKNGRAYINYREIWSFFENYFSMNYTQIQGLTKEWVEEHFKLGATTTIVCANPRNFSVEEHFKLGATTTPDSLRITKPWWRNITNWG